MPFLYAKKFNIVIQIMAISHSLLLFPKIKGFVTFISSLIVFLFGSLDASVANFWEIASVLTFEYNGLKIIVQCQVGLISFSHD